MHASLTAQHSTAVQQRCRVQQLRLGHGWPQFWRPCTGFLVAMSTVFVVVSVAAPSRCRAWRVCCCQARVKFFRHVPRASIDMPFCVGITRCHAADLFTHVLWMTCPARQAAASLQILQAWKWAGVEHYRVGGACFVVASVCCEFGRRG